MTEAIPVYFVHWRAPDWLQSAIEAAQASEDVRPLITVIDNGASLLADDLPSDVGLLTPGRNTGYAGGANTALDHARHYHPSHAFAVVASHDAHVLPGTLASLVTAARSRTRAGVLAPRLVAPVPTSGGTWDGRSVRRLDDEFDDVRSRDWASGTLLLIRAECHAEIQGFDEGFSSYVEDVDFCLRARDHGWDVCVVGSAVAWGLGSAATDANDRIAVNTARLVLKRHGLRALGGHIVAQLWLTCRSVAVAFGYGNQPAASRRKARESAAWRARIVVRIMQMLFRNVSGFGDSLPGIRDPAAACRPIVRHRRWRD